VAVRFPEICAAEARFLAEVLGAEVDRREHILTGCSACEYHVRFTTVQENS
jgi:predicted ArsR family transcriptional regulator